MECWARRTELSALLQELVGVLLQGLVDVLQRGLVGVLLQEPPHSRGGCGRTGDLAPKAAVRSSILSRAAALRSSVSWEGTHGPHSTWDTTSS